MIEVHVIELDGPVRSGCARDALRAILAAELGRTPEIHVDPRGKPALVGQGPAFNVSHSGGLALVAISRAAAVGVDIEAHDPRRDVVAVSRRFFSAAEAEVVATDPSQFWRLWCRKEACLKARGTGLTFPLSEMDVRGDIAGWLIADLEIAPGYSAAVAQHGGARNVRVLDQTESVEIRRSGSAIIARSTAM